MREEKKKRGGWKGAQKKLKLTLICGDRNYTRQADKHTNDV